MFDDDRVDEDGDWRVDAEDPPEGRVEAPTDGRVEAEATPDGRVEVLLPLLVDGLLPLFL